MGQAQPGIEPIPVNWSEVYRYVEPPPRFVPPGTAAAEPEGVADRGQEEVRPPQFLGEGFAGGVQTPLGHPLGIASPMSAAVPIQDVPHPQRAASARRL
eukprot:CAMPEP_0194497814 /NCGR_PEP_ID=MMETSP0253-20130528/14638_1 /TAXON_ID=2966 /ORGANISM="Noctiluca scintillans" /LENGTH=98 /DNA_ID=CAMNT_0039339361 /DNA_START=33 /DNA_END=325 /DNA_ORIENTATION=+